MKHPDEPAMKSLIMGPKNPDEFGMIMLHSCFDNAPNLDTPLSFKPFFETAHEACDIATTEKLSGIRAQINAAVKKALIRIKSYNDLVEQMESVAKDLSAIKERFFPDIKPYFPDGWEAETYAWVSALDSAYQDIANKERSQQIGKA